MINYNNIIENDFEKEFYIYLHKEIINFLKSNKATFWDIVRFVGGSDRRVLRLLNEMKKSGEIYIEDKVIYGYLRKKGHANTKEILCTNCKGKIILDNEKSLKVRNFMNKIYNEKPIPTFIYDQRPVTINTTVNRALYLLFRDDLIDKEIAIIGDDDLTSLAIAFLGGAKKIVVFDIDERLIKFINKMSKRYKLGIKAYTKDLTKGISSNFKNKFDVFITDPTPNKDFFSLFIKIGLKLLKNGQNKVGYVSFFPSHQKISLIFQEILLKNKLIITDMIPRFTEYDFIEFTYREEDKRLLDKFDTKEEKISFHENLTRFVTSSEKLTLLKENKIENKQSFEIGKATKMVLDNLEKDPAYNLRDKNFIKKIANKMKDK